MPRRRFWSRGPLLYASGAAIVLTLLVAALTFTLPGFLSRDYDAKSLASLRGEAARTRQAFAGLLASLEARKARFAGAACSPKPRISSPSFAAPASTPRTRGSPSRTATASSRPGTGTS